MKSKTQIVCLIGVAFMTVAFRGLPAQASEDVIVRQDIIAASFPEQELGISSAAISNGKRESLDVPVVSWRDLPFSTVKKQALDYSCGSAALSTLLSYVYQTKTSEGSIFKAMFESGNKEKIRKEGFSLLDMRNYLKTKGFNAAGFKVKLDVIEKNKVPFIALIRENGYNHFVVVKSVKGGRVLIGDPNRGNVILAREKFVSMWNGIALIVSNKARIARSFFDNDKEWTYAHTMVTPSQAEYRGMDNTALQPIQWQIAPVTTDILGGINQQLTSTLSP
ncbi:MAG: hypothetical protein EOM37_04705 [Proteobacteria bacterium]|jgi:predicted double-glycine peptidase|nr:C39 family peptidase [Alphaproteobacteria bacterium]NCC03332.1 hypothetical protein [Pseudomonadota bacterium]